MQAYYKKSSLAAKFIFILVDSNKQNKTFGKKKIYMYLRKTNSSTKIYSLVGFHAGSVIGPYLFENIAGNVLTVNGGRYREIHVM